MDDASLVLAAAGGDKEAFAAIYDRYAAPIHDFLHSVLRDRDEAADVLHDTFILAGSRLQQLRDPAKLRPWLYAIARHRALRVAERRARSRPLEEIEVTATGPGPDDVAASGEVVDLVWAAAEGLNPRDRVVLDLHLRQGLEGQELGDAIGVSADHAYVMMSRLRDQLERSVGALLVARQGRRSCPELAVALEGWDGHYSSVWRKRVARHVDGCAACRSLRSRLANPASLFTSTPAVALPAELRQRVLDGVELAHPAGRPWPATAGGFPPPMMEKRRHRALIAAMGAAALLLIGAAVAVNRVEEPLVTRVDSVSVTTTAPAIAATEVTGTTVLPSTTVSTAATTPRTTSTAVVATVPTTLPPSTTSSTAPRDSTPPRIGALRVSPQTIRPQGACSNSVTPQQATVEVSVTDPSGISAVTLNPGGAVMAPRPGGGYKGVVGPVPATGFGSTAMEVTVTATDTAGNVGSATATITIQCDPFPQ